jgi:glucosamine-phosphate N-acetyltransferase
MDSSKQISIRHLKKTDIYPHSKFIDTLNELSDTNQLSFDSCSKFWSIYDSNPNQHTIVADVEGSIIGTASLSIEFKFLHGGSRVGHIEDVAVMSTVREKGIGALLINHLVGIAKNEKCYKIILDCSSENIPFYIKCGFQVSQHCMRMNLSSR